MRHLGKLQHKIEYNDFGDAAIIIWYDNLYEVKQIGFYEPACGDTEKRGISSLKKRLDERLWKIFELLGLATDSGEI